MLQDGRGTVTAGNSSMYGDATAAVVLMGSDIAKSRGITPIARVLHLPKWVWILHIWE